MAQEFAAALEAASGLNRVLALPAAFADLAGDALARRVGGRRGRQDAAGGPSAWLGRPGHELAQAARALRRRPAFTLPALLTLALGVGAALSVFAVVDAVLLRPLPYPGGERLVTVVHHAPGMDMAELPNAPASVLTYREARAFDMVAAYHTQAHNLQGPERTDRVEVLEAEPALFPMLGASARLGRLFEEADALPDAPQVALLSYETWLSRFGGAEDVLGRTVELGGTAREIVGVLPAGLAFPEAGLAFATPYVLPDREAGGNFGIAMLARLAENVDLAMAQREVAALQSRVVERFGPGVEPGWIELAGWSATVVSYRDLLVNGVRAALWLVLGTVALVLLIAVANVANLFLLRAEDRHREIAVRAALGAGRARLAGAFLAEGILVAAAGTAAGCVLAVWAVRAFVVRAADRVPRLAEAAIDGRALLVAVSLVLLAGLLFAAIPMLRHLGRTFAATLRAGRGATEARERLLVRRALVATQVALALVLLAGSGLMLRSFVRLRGVDVGVRQEGVLVASLSLGRDTERERLRLISAELLEAVRAMPEVASAAATNLVPLTPGGMQGGPIYVDGQLEATGALERIVFFKVITPDFFATLDIPLIAGRAMTAADATAPVPPVWINQMLAVQHFGDASPLGRQVRFNDREDHLVHEIAGVVGDTRDFGLREPAYGGFSTLNVVVRTAGPESAAPALRRVLERTRPDLPVVHLLSLEEAVGRDMAETTLTVLILGLAAAAALLLGAVGIYGVIAYAVGRRAREIAIRMALGARAAGVRRMVVRQGMQPVALGMLLGLGATLLLSRAGLMAAVLFETSARDPAILAGVTLLLATVAAVASYVPARRASRVDPADVLRSE
jgi:predicted permease